jgi:hypothetical protein
VVVCFRHSPEDWVETVKRRHTDTYDMQNPSALDHYFARFRAPFICHPFEDGVLTIAKLRASLLQQQLVLPNEANKLNFIYPYSMTPRDEIIDEVPEDVEFVRVKQSLRRVYVLD